MVIKIAKMDEYTLNQDKKPTNPQWQAIALTGSDILVSAAAGSGKTEVLSERIVRRVVEDRWNINEMLVLSFTTAAARNMLDRVEKKLTARLAKSDWEYLKMQRLLMSEAQITTIDSFCLNVLKKFYYLVEEDIFGEKKYLSSTFKVLADNSQLKVSAINEVIENFAEEDKSIIHLLFNIFGKKDEISTFLESLYNKMVTLPNYKNYIKTELTKNIRATIPNLKFQQITKKIENLDFEDFDCYSRKLFNFFQYLKKELKDVTSQGEVLKELIANSNISESKIKNLTNILEQDKEEFSLFLNKQYTLDYLNNLENECNFENSISNFDEIEDAINYYDTLLEFLDGLEDILLAIDELFIAKKRAGDFLDFSDLNHLAIKALEKDVDGEKLGTEASEYYQKLFKEIYVDEYQDNNDLQEYILNLIRGKDSCFFRVGDVKQAIYGFRGSNPQLFENKYVSYKKITDYISEKDYDNSQDYEFDADPFGVCVVLKENFRSVENVLHSSNVVFNRLMHRGNAGITYDEDSALYYPAVKPKCQCDIPTYVLQHKDKDIVLYNIVKEINDLVEKNPKVKYSDFALLFRNANKMLEYKKYLEDNGIPVYLKEKQGFTESHSFNILFNLLRFLDNPYLDSSLIVLLRSALFGFDNNELLELSMISGDSLYEKLLHSNLQKYSQTRNMLQHWLNISLNKSVVEFTKQITREVSFEQFLVTLPSSDSELDYFENFLDVLASCSEQNINLSFALQTLENIKNKGTFDTKRMASSDSVSLITIHMSKGLEFDYVFLVELDQELNKKDYTSKLLYSQELGLSLDATVFLGDSCNEDINLFNSLNANLIKTKMYEEETRNLYVAMTRAAKGLYLVMNKDISKEELDGINPKEQVIGRFSDCKNFAAMLALAFSFYDTTIADETENKANIQSYNLLEPIEEVIEEDEDCYSIFSEEIAGKIELNIVSESISKERVHPSKTSYSAIKKIKEAKKREDNKLEEKKEYLNLESLRKKNSAQTALIRGNVIHKLFEKIVKDNIANRDITDVENYLTSLVQTSDHIVNIREQRILTQEEYKIISNKKDKEAIEKFMLSDVFEKIKQAKDVFTEVSFTLGESTKKLFASSKEDLVILQGVVDLLIKLDDDNFIIVDYKTDNILKKNGVEILKERHSEQLDIYAEAVCKFYGEHCKVEKYIYSYVLGELIKI